MDYTFVRFKSQTAQHNLLHQGFLLLYSFLHVLYFHFFVSHKKKVLEPNELLAFLLLYFILVRLFLCSNKMKTNSCFVNEKLGPFKLFFLQFF